MDEKCLRFTDEAEAIEVLASFRYEDEDGKECWNTGSPLHALVPFGTLYDIDNTDPENPVAVPLIGFHVDVIVRDLALWPEGIEAYEVTPTQRKHVFL